MLASYLGSHWRVMLTVCRDPSSPRTEQDTAATATAPQPRAELAASYRLQMLDSRVAGK